MPRKPPQVTFETWVDRQIRDGAANGAFDDLPSGPIELTEHHDEDWWIKKKIRDEGLEVLPPSLTLRRDIERAVRAARGAPSEAEARRQIEAVNDRIRAANRIAIAGPPVNLVAYDVDELVMLWHAAHPADHLDGAADEIDQVDPPARPRKWFGMRLRRRPRWVVGQR
ncbi:MAG: hypothetical protein JWO77_2751 [Ilumatobacteraceae bacterium]|nr:hypothetical protein [Ilumatobacteraceae bacterium]